MKKAIFSLLLMAASVIGASAQGSATTAQNPQDVDVLYAKNLLAVGTEAPAFPALKKGTWTVLDFWATWCPPCVHELPLLNAFHRSHHAQGWQVLGVAIDKAAAVQQFLRKLPLDYPVALAGPGGVGLTRALGNLPGGLPFTLVTAANGRILHRKIGQIQAPDLEHWAASMV